MWCFGEDKGKPYYEIVPYQRETRGQKAKREREVGLGTGIAVAEIQENPALLFQPTKLVSFR